ncbi:MAG: hypothetical protein D6759_10195 [Chloroflexi bacterium]|nr:MAG: hypothetical protein D6759_10195 [Chloroflexota bacterium]
MASVGRVARIGERRNSEEVPVVEGVEAKVRDDETPAFHGAVHTGICAVLEDGAAIVGAEAPAQFRRALLEVVVLPRTGDPVGGIWEGLAAGFCDVRVERTDKFDDQCRPVVAGIVEAPGGVGRDGEVVNPVRSHIHP